MVILRTTDTINKWFEKRADAEEDARGKNTSKTDLFNEALEEYMANHPEPPKAKSKIRVQSTYWPADRQKGGGK